MIPTYPKIIPELDYSGTRQTAVNTSSFKYWLLSTFFYERVEKNGRLYFRMARSGELHYMPLFTMTKALAHYNDFIQTGEEEHKELFLDTSKKLVEDMEKEGKMWGWKHDNLLQLPGYPKKYKSYSALFQGRGLGVLIRYYQFNKTEELREKITGVLKSFEVLSSEGGVLKREGEDKYYLEYSWGDESPVVWNGFMSALVGLHDASLYAPRPITKKSKALFDEGLDTLKKNTGHLFFKNVFLEWIRYDDNKLYFADGPYIDIEVRQLEYLKEIDPCLEESCTKIKEIEKYYKCRASFYEYWYFIKKRLFL